MLRILILGAHKWRPFCKGFSQACDLTKRGMCQSNVGWKEFDSASDGEELKSSSEVESDS